MKKITTIPMLLLAALLFGLLPCAAQSFSMRDAFTQMPDSLLPLLTKNNRMDMMDFVENHMEARVTNRLDANSTLDTLTTNYLRLTLTPNSEVEMKLLPVADSVLIAVIQTAKGPAPDSFIAFYTTAWQPLDASTYYTRPALTAFEVTPAAELSDTDRQRLTDLDMELMVLHFSLTDTSLTVTRGVEQLPRADRAAVAALLRPVVLKWQAGYNCN